MRQIQLKELLHWAMEKRKQTESMIKESKESHNYSKETEYKGRKSAYEELLRLIGMNPGDLPL